MLIEVRSCNKTSDLLHDRENACCTLALSSWTGEATGSCLGLKLPSGSSLRIVGVVERRQSMVTRYLLKSSLHEEPSK